MKQILEMFGLKIFIMRLVVICFNYSHYINASIQVTTKSRIIDKGILFANAHSFKEGKLVYAICDSNSKPTTKCKIVQENYPYTDEVYSCLVTLENNCNRGFLTVVVAALGKDKAVLIWKYKDDNYSTIVTVGTINLKTCEMKRVNIPNSDLSVLLELYYITKFVSYNDDSFEIFYNDPKTQSSEAQLYKMQFNGNGNIKTEPEVVNIESGRYLFVSPVAYGSSYKGHVYEKKNITDLSKTPKYYLWLVKRDGTKVNLAKYNGFPRSDVSAGNNFISLCYKPQAKSYITCTQYDQHGNGMFTTVLEDTSHEIQLLTSYNLPNGGFLLMYGTNKCDQHEKCSNETLFEVVRIGSDGKKVGSLHARQLVIPSGKIRTSYIYKNENKEYCATVIVRDAFSNLSLKRKTPLNLTIVANCFTEFDFSNGIR